MPVGMSFSKGMTSNQLWLAMQQDPATRKQLGGIFPNDLLIQHHPVMRPQIIFVNTAPVSHPGKHWTAFYYPLADTEPIEYFDSTGTNPVNYRGSFKLFLRGQKSGYIYCTKRLQNPESSVCGEYCLYYAIHRCHGQRMNAIVSSMTSDEMVYSFVHNYFQM